MTVTDRPDAPSTDQAPTTIDRFALAGFDLYRDIHKGIRAELFAVTAEAGSLDPADTAGRAALADHVAFVADVLQSHAEHEDEVIQPALEVHLPDQAEAIEAEHAALDAIVASLRAQGRDVVEGRPRSERQDVQRLYLELGRFTGRYLTHQDMEERQVMPALERAVGTEAVIAMNEAIVSGIPPDEMARSLAFMLPAMNVDDRAELLGGMQAGAPPEVFAGVWSLTGSVLAPADRAAVATRLGLA
jgi:hemerythrin-like domain-containing protein